MSRKIIGGTSLDTLSGDKSPSWDVPGFSSRGIFLSYRREDAAPHGRLLQLELSERIPDVHVFMDLDSGEAGLDFAEVIREAVDSCALLVALIGRQWATVVDDQGHRWLDDPDDRVRFEIQTALERGVRVIPVLVDGARPLRQQELPPELQKLARLNALTLSNAHYQYDADRLLDLILRVLATAPGTGPDAQSIRSDGDGLDKAAHKGPEAVRNDRVRFARLIADAERIAYSITDKEAKALALNNVAAALTATDPVRAARLSTDAERVAQSILDEFARRSVLDEIAETLAPTDADRAERIAQSITGELRKASALAKVAKKLAATDPDHAARLIAGAEGVIHSITSEEEKAVALSDIAETLQATNPDDAARLLADAERIACLITSKPRKPGVLAYVAEKLAATDPEHAERVAQSIFDEKATKWSLVTTKKWSLADFVSSLARYDPDLRGRRAKVAALADIAKKLAATDPDYADRLIAQAERIAYSIADENENAGALDDIARALAATDPGRAERIAKSINDEIYCSFHKAWALNDIARALAATDPDYAERIARSINDADQMDRDAKASALAHVARALAATDLDRAERIAKSITHAGWNAWALAGIAEALAVTDLDRAERIAKSITDADENASALAGIAEALAVTDPDRAERIAHSITSEVLKISALVKIAEAYID